VRSYDFREAYGLGRTCVRHSSRSLGRAGQAIETKSSEHRTREHGSSPECEIRASGSSPDCGLQASRNSPDFATLGHASSPDFARGGHGATLCYQPAPDGSLRPGRMAETLMLSTHGTSSPNPPRRLGTPAHDTATGGATFRIGGSASHLAAQRPATPIALVGDDGLRAAVYAREPSLTTIPAVGNPRVPA
jgi:hypothetical protein